MNKKVLLTTTVLWLAACSVGPDYKKPEFFSDEQIQKSLHLTPAATKVSLEWYKQFNDATLNQLIEDGLKNSPNVKIATEKMRQARQTLRINKVQYLPMLNANSSYSYLKDSKAYMGQPISTDYYQLGADAAWEIDIWGGGRRLTERSSALFEATAAGLQNVKLALTAEIATTYINLRSAQEQLQIAKKNEALQTELYEVVQQKYTAGLSNDIALNQAKYLLSTTKQTIPQLETEVKAYQNALSTLTGHLPNSLEAQIQVPKNNLVNQPLVYNVAELYALPIEVLRNRPDVRALEYQLMAQNAAVGQAIAELYPNVSLSGFWGFQNKEISGLIGSSADTYNYSPVIKLPIFHWGALTNNVKLQKSLTKESLQHYKQGVLDAASEVENATTAVEKEYQRNLQAAAALASQQEVAALTDSKYQNGLVEFSEVLTAQQNLLNAQNALVGSNAKIYGNVITFYKAIGGGYENKPSSEDIQTADANKDFAPYKD